MARAALAIVAVIGCAHHPTMLFGEPAPDYCAGGASSERCLGWLVDRIMMMSANEYDDRELSRYVASVGERIARATGDQRAWTFRVLDDPDVQANANISTEVYVTRGALARLRSEAELAGLLGHEIGHVLAGHAREALLDELRGTADDPKRQLRAARDDEIQADELAVMLSARAGYDPHAVETMLRALAAGQSDEDDPANTHPRWTERLARVQAYADRFGGGELAEATYRVHVHDLVVDDDPRDAALVGHTAVFARVHEAIDLPAWNSASAHGRWIEVELPNATKLELGVLPRTMIDALPMKDIIGNDGFVLHHALIVSASGPGAAAVLASVRAGVRVPSAAELAQLHPKLVDLAAPRPLWPK